MALVTFLQAKAYGKGLKLLPAAMLARFQHGTMLYNAERGKLAPPTLPASASACAPIARPPAPGCAAFLTTIMASIFPRVQWVTFEDGHVAEAKDPAGVIRAAAGQDITQMLIDGELDAAIYGAAMPDDPRLHSVIPDPDAAARAWYGKHGLVPVNHMVVVTDELARVKSTGGRRALSFVGSRQERGRRPRASIDTAPFGKEANRPCLELLISYAVQQRLIPHRLHRRALVMRFVGLQAVQCSVVGAYSAMLPKINQHPLA